MAFSSQDLSIAQTAQINAAEDNNQTIRLVAGPGTGKSKVIEQRVFWLINSQNVDPKNIIAISFTRAASVDLKNRIYNYCSSRNVVNVNEVSVSTLHSLALRILRQTGNLNLYPTNPVILDGWEMENIFDSEFAETINSTPTRCEEIRVEHEAFWSTGNWNLPSFLQPTVPITTAERTAFTGYYPARTQLYSCVLPGEVIRTCVDLIKNGHIDPVSVLGVEHLIVDEVQDLNFCDFEFIDLLIAKGVNVFISGDDDQSVYAFRYAFPQGIQGFTARYTTASSHVLNSCFRCTVSVLSAAQNVINAYAAPGRIQKNLTSLYNNSNPQNNGFTHGYIFNTPSQEANYIAHSCQQLITSGVPANDIMILISNKRQILSDILTAFDNLHVDYDINQEDDFKESSVGRFILGLLRLKENDDDYVAYRTLLGTPRGVGLGTVKSVGDKVLTNFLNFKNIFVNSLPINVFTKREANAINKVVNNLNTFASADLNDTINQTNVTITTLITNNFTTTDIQSWQDFISNLPTGMTLSELKEFLQTDSIEFKDNILNNVNARLGQQTQQTPAVIQPKVKITTFHSSKGLDSKVVFIPSLEEGIFPTQRTQQFPGLIMENARLMYVAITRAKAACILSYCRRRNVFGANLGVNASRFAIATNVSFSSQNNQALTQQEILGITTSITNLR